MKGILKGTAFSLIVTFVFILLLSLITYFTDIDSKITSIGVYASVVISVTLGALISAKKCEKSVLPHAMAVSVIYLAVLICVSAALNHTLMLNGHFITMTAGIFAAGFLGAVLGK